MTTSNKSFFSELLQPPSAVLAQTGGDLLTLQPRDHHWTALDVTVITLPQDGLLSVDIQAETTPLERIQLRWKLPVPEGLRYLGDAWERAYGDLEWRAQVPERIMPWYFLTHDGYATHGYGVKTQPGALCFWMVDPGGVSLWLDIRNGGSGVELGGRRLHAADVAAREGQPVESPFSAARAFCKLLCDQPRLPDHPVYGSNNWYYAYGQSSHAEILEDTRLVVNLAPDGPNRPYMVIDAGWQPDSGDEQVEATITGGPYTGADGAPLTNPRFPDMPGLAAQMKALGARPGIWIRPLAAYRGAPDSQLLPVKRAVDASAKIKVLDPSIPEVLDHIQNDFATLHRWGYELIKHDWASCDIFGRWGFQMGAALTSPGWHFYDRSKTTAEIVLGLFRAIRAGAGSGPDESVVIGCNTIGHLGAGLFELQRTGDDTSGREWERTRKYGINTLAFRAPQHGAFFAADADCVGHTAAIPWEMNAQWLDLLAHSGTPIFVSMDPRLIGGEQERALRAAFAQAAQPQDLAEPLDWLESTCPSHWRLTGEEVRYQWTEANGAGLLTPSIPMWWGS